jgi:hypothetical protein
MSRAEVGFSCTVMERGVSLCSVVTVHRDMGLCFGQIANEYVGVKREGGVRGERG